jgi:hypothetical protein
MSNETETQAEPKLVEWVVVVAPHYWGTGRTVTAAINNLVRAGGGSPGQKLELRAYRQAETSVEPYLDQMGRLFVGEDAETTAAFAFEWTEQLDDLFDKFRDRLEIELARAAPDNELTV